MKPILTQIMEMECQQTKVPRRIRKQLKELVRQIVKRQKALRKEEKTDKLDVNHLREGMNEWTKHS